MVSADGIADVGFLLVLLSEFHTQLSVRHLGLIIGHLADIMQQTCTASLLGIQAQLTGHDGTQVGSLARVLQQVLTIAGAVLHLTNHADEFGVQAMDTHVDSGAFTGLDDFFLDLTAHFGNNLLDACRMDAAVAHQLVQCQTGDLAAHGVKARQHDSLGGVIHNDFDASGSLQGTDIASLAADDASLNLVIINMEDGHSILDSGLGGNALDGLNDDALCLLVGGHLGIVHDVVDIAGGIGLRLVLERLDELLLGFLGRQSTHVLQSVAHALLHLVNLLLALLEHGGLVVHVHLEVVQLVAAALDFALLLVERHFALLELGFAGLHLGQSGISLFLGIALDGHSDFLAFQHLLVLEHFSFKTGFLDNLVGLRLSILLAEVQS